MKLFVFPKIMTTSHAIFIYCMFASISLICYLAFSTNPLGWPQYHAKVAKPEIDGSGISGSYEKTKIYHILFGIGGSSKTWNKRQHYSELWWKPNITRGFVWLEEKPSEEVTWPATSPPYRVSGDTSRFHPTSWNDWSSANRIARIVKESFELGLDNVRWFVMGDDDTVFFTENLVTMLAKYDHNQMYYIGANSESVDQDIQHSYTTAFGGGGFAISYPLATELVGLLDGCINRYAHYYGSDEKVHCCLSEIGVTITVEHGFHQFDIRGNPYGLVAAHPLAPLVSLHHLDSVESLFPKRSQINSLKKLIEAYEIDPGRTLQRSICYDLSRNWSVSVSWGYTVQLYPSLVTADQLEMALLTFTSWMRRGTNSFTFNTRPVSSDPCQRPVVYFLDRVERVGTGQTLTTYERNVEEAQNNCDGFDYAPALAVRYFNVSAFNFNPDLWRKAPRRQCCEIMSGLEGVDSVIQVKIRGCKPFESATPP